MRLTVAWNTVISETSMKPKRLTLWPLLLGVFSLVAVSSGCRPAKKAKDWDPMCKDNPSVAKMCPLDLTHKCPNLMLSDFSTTNTHFDSHDQRNYGLINWSSSVGIHCQSSLIFFFLGAGTALTLMFGKQRCKQGRKHKREMTDLLSKIASSSATQHTRHRGPLRALQCYLYSSNTSSN